MKQWTITTADVGVRIDIFLNQHLEHSRTKITTLIHDGKVTVNESVPKAKYKLRLGDVVQAEDFTAKPMALEGIAMPLDIVYEDTYLIVINKPRGLVVHPGKGVQEPTLLHGLIHYFNTTHDNTVRPGMVHRIDKNTSGLLVIAKDAISHHFLAEQLLDKTMRRAYYALVHGHCPTQTINAPLARDPQDAKRMMVTDKNSKPACSHFKLVSCIGNYSLIQCELETGRTHQIRVHAQYSGHPLVGDPTYGHPNDKDNSGQYLFAYRLEFIHPNTRKTMIHEVSIPDYFRNLITQP